MGKLPLLTSDDKYQRNAVKFAFDKIVDEIQM